MPLVQQGRKQLVEHGERGQSQSDVGPRTSAGISRRRGDADQQGCHENESGQPTHRTHLLPTPSTTREAQLFHLLRLSWVSCRRRSSLYKPEGGSGSSRNLSPLRVFYRRAIRIATG